jgi:hypothetical protein
MPENPEPNLEHGQTGNATRNLTYEGLANEVGYPDIFKGSYSFQTQGGFPLTHLFVPHEIWAIWSKIGSH